MTLNQLVAFACAVRIRSFTAATKELGLTQPGVSDLAQRLESGLGEVLFARHRRALKPTATGRELYTYAKHAIEAAQNGAADVGSSKTLEGGSAGGSRGTSAAGPRSSSRFAVELVKLLDLPEPELVSGGGTAWDREAGSPGEEVEARAGVVRVEVLHEGAEKQAAAAVAGGFGNLFQQVPDRRSFGVEVEVELSRPGPPSDRDIEFREGRRALHPSGFDQELLASIDQLGPLAVVASVKQRRLLHAAERPLERDRRGQYLFDRQEDPSTASLETATCFWSSPAFDGRYQDDWHRPCHAPARRLRPRPCPPRRQRTRRAEATTAHACSTPNRSGNPTPSTSARHAASTSTRASRCTVMHNSFHVPARVLVADDAACVTPPSPPTPASGGWPQRAERAYRRSQAKRRAGNETMGRCLAIAVRQREKTSNGLHRAPDASIASTIATSLERTNPATASPPQ